MSSKRPPEAPKLPPPPPAPELMDVIDKISGVETITVVGADGKKRRVTQRMPLTKEEQELKTQAENLISTAVKNIETLYQHDPASVVNYQPFINAFANINNERMSDLAQIGDFKDIAEKVSQFKKMNSDLTMKAFDESQRMSEENLARRGLSNSTQASEYRAAMAKERASLAQEVEVNALNYGEDLASRQLGRENALYNVKEQGRQARLEEAELGYTLERQKEDDIARIRQNAIDENLGMIDLGQNIAGSDAQRSQLGLNQNQNAIATFNSQATNQNQRYANDIARVTNQYGMDLNQHKATPARFGQRLVDLGLSTAGRAAGAYATGGMSEIGRAAANGAGKAGDSPARFGGPGRAKAFGQLQRVGR